MKNKNTTKDNFLILKALEEADKDKAIQLISTPTLDHKELSDIIECGLMKKLRYKDGTPVRISNEVLMAGIRNRLQQIIDESKIEY